MRLTDLTFEQWLEHAFGKEVRIGRNQWFFDQDIDWWDPEPAIAVDYLTRLFTDAPRHLQWFADTQIAQGFTYLLSTSAMGDNGWLYARSVPGEQRRQCVQALSRLFADLFAPRCTPSLGHLSEAGGPLNTVCYMWWDEFPAIALPDDPDRAMLHGAALQAMADSLQLPSMACQESALHGLGHWRRYDPQHVERIVDRYLAANAPADQRLLSYARAARTGCVL
jgi:hypothetical protein